MHDIGFDTARRLFDGTQPSGDEEYAPGPGYPASAETEDAASARYAATKKAKKDQARLDQHDVAPAEPILLAKARELEFVVGEIVYPSKSHVTMAMTAHAEVNARNYSTSHQAPKEPLLAARRCVATHTTSPPSQTLQHFTALTVALRSRPLSPPMPNLAKSAR